jgi:hypothetical protein
MLIFDDDIPPIPKGAKYFMITTDDYSRYRWFFILKRKSDAVEVLEDWVIMIQTQFYKTPKRIRTDCGKEWLNKALNKFAIEKGIQCVTEWALPEPLSHWLADLPCPAMVN